jgi:hypothetical protein
LALLLFALLAATLSILLQTTSRDVYSNNTPRHFDWIFFIADNWKRALTSLLLICIALRFAPELFGVEISEFWALVIGFGNDKIAQILKDKTNLLGQKKQP